MKKKIKIIFTLLSMLILFGCDYETHVINTVHEDGSVTRKVTMKNSEEDFDPGKYRVPVDSTWNIEITSEINENNDTTWILTAEKHFASVDEINDEYTNDLGSNKYLNRSAQFSKSFKWFTTVFRYSETVEKIMTVHCPVTDFLSDEELKFFYLPDKVQNELTAGSDSLQYKALSDTIDTKSEVWLWTGFVRQWIEIFYNVVEDHPDLSIRKEEMHSKEPDIVKVIIAFEESEEAEEGEIINDLEEDEEVIQSIEKELEKEEELDDIQIIVESVLGKEFYATFKTEIDSSISILETMTDPYFSAENYDMEIRMPGRIMSSNGYADTELESNGGGGILWTVQGDYFLLEQYEMWVESKISNVWAWIVTGVFVLFVITGLIVRSRKEKS